MNQAGAPSPKVAANRIRQPPEIIFDLRYDSDSVIAFALNFYIRWISFAPTRNKKLWWCSGYHIQKVFGTWHKPRLAGDIRKAVGSNPNHGISLLVGDEDAIHKTGFLPIIVVTFIGPVVLIPERFDLETSDCQVPICTI